MVEEKDLIVEFTFGLDAPDIEDSEKLYFSKRLLPELRNLDEVIRADRAEDLSEKEGIPKSALTPLVGVLTAEVSWKNFKKFLGSLGDRLKDKPIKGSIKVGKDEASFEVGSIQELKEVEKTLANLMEKMKEKGQS